MSKINADRGMIKCAAEDHVIVRVLDVNDDGDKETQKLDASDI